MQNFKEELEKKIIEFKLTEPKIAITLVKKAAEKKRKHYEFLKLLKKNTEILIDDIIEKPDVARLLRKIDPREPFKQEYLQTPMIGTDGSYQVVGGKGNRYYVMVTAVIVVLPRGVKTSADNIKIIYPEKGIDVISFDDPTFGELTNNIAEDIMMLYETNALHNIPKIIKQSDKKIFYVFIDGPITDPPRELTEKGLGILSGLSGIGSTEDYIKFRVDAMLNIYHNSLLVVGYVKAVRNASLLRNTLASKGINKSLLDKYSGDSELAKLLLLEYLSMDNDTNGYAYIGPFKAVGDLYKQYMNHGLAIYYIYGLNRLRNRVFRLEIGIPNEVDSEEKIEELFSKLYLVSIGSTLPGQNHPLPIILAHEKCKIRRGAAELIYDLVISGLTKDILTSKSADTDKKILISMLEEELVKV